MSALSPGPAPGLVNEWISAPVFWTIVACAAVVGLIVLWAEFRKAWAEKSAELDAFLQDAYEPDAADQQCHEYRDHLGVWVCVCCGDTVRPPDSCGGLHRYEARGQSLTCTVCGFRTALPYDQMGGVA